MLTSISFVRGVAVLILGLGLVGCATGPVDRAIGLGDAKRPAWALKATHDELVVAVSPAGKTLRLVGSSGAVLGAGIDALVNEKHRVALREALGDYDPGEVFRQGIRAGLEEVLTQGIEPVAPLGSTAGLDSIRQAEQIRFERLAKRGIDALLDLKMTYGVYGHEGAVVTKLEGRLVQLPRGRKVWENTLVVFPGDILASGKLKDPTQTLMPDVAAPRLKAAEDAVAQWTADGGKLFRERFEAAVDAVVSALVCDLGLAQETLGEYYLGKLALMRKSFEEAQGHFRNAAELDPALADAKNGLSVALARMDRIDEAIAVAQALTETLPDYGPAHYNLAWWHAIEKGDPAAGKPHYDKARALDMPSDPALEKKLGLAR
jgi:tetratricopeptide (TPR) repeat protein